MSDTTLQQQMIRRLDVLILLNLDNLSSGVRTTITSKVQRLIGFGLAPAEVASILGKPVNYVTAITSSSERAPKKKENRGG